MIMIRGRYNYDYDYNYDYEHDYDYDHDYEYDDELTCKGPPESPWQESWPPLSCPAQRKMSGMNSCRPARRNIDLQRSFETIGTCTWNLEW